MTRRSMQWCVILVLVLSALACIGGGSRVLPAGEAAPLFGVKQGGGTVTLDDLRGQVVLVNFWAGS